MSNEEKVLELFLQEQKNKISELSQQIMILTTRNKMLEQELKEKTDKLEEYELINIKKKNQVHGFSHKTKIIGR